MVILAYWNFNRSVIPLNMERNPFRTMKTFLIEILGLNKNKSYDKYQSVDENHSKLEVFGVKMIQN